jgi:hypothetical protein
MSRKLIGKDLSATIFRHDYPDLRAPFGLHVLNYALDAWHRGKTQTDVVLEMKKVGYSDMATTIVACAKKCRDFAESLNEKGYRITGVGVLVKVEVPLEGPAVIPTKDV